MQIKKSIDGHTKFIITDGTEKSEMFHVIKKHGKKVIWNVFLTKHKRRGCEIDKKQNIR